MIRPVTPGKLLQPPAELTDQDVEKWKLSTDLRRFIQSHSHVETRKQIATLAADWLCIAAAVVVCESHFSLFTYLLVVIIIASRQHALLVLVHEAAHFRLAKNMKLNDFVSEVLCAFPLLFSTTWYRKHHLAHHRYLNTDDDPDWARKVHLKEWQYPQAKMSVLKMLAAQVARGGYEWCFFMWKIAQMSSRTYNLRRTGYYLAAAVALTTFHLWPVFGLYWAAPFLFVFPLIQRWRSVSEHFGLPRTHEFNSSRNVLAGPVQRFLLSPHGVNYHLVHHLFPSVPHYNIPAVHAYLMKSDIYRHHAHNNKAYIGSAHTVWADIVTPIKNN